MYKHLLWCLLILFVSNSYALDPPSCEDPWYYQSNDRGLTFMVPDKAQHYYGSYLLSSIATKHLGNLFGTISALTLGIIWEIKDSYTPLNKGVVGFSYRDLIADGLGVLSSRINGHFNTKLYLTYDTQNETIQINTTWTF